jgi:hypothetical protein
MFWCTICTLRGEDFWKSLRRTFGSGELKKKGDPQIGYLCNDVEGWHNRVNTHAQKSNLQFYLLIELMYKEASKKPLQLKMISDGKLRRRQRKQTKMVQWKILQLWDDYANNKITASHLLKKCGSLYTPGV